MMFVLKSTHNKVTAQLREAIASFHGLHAKYTQLFDKYEQLVKQINARGGQEFLDHGSLSRRKPPFDQAEIKQLIALCHPDKHDNSKVASDITAKLISMRTKRTNQNENDLRRRQ
jgi:hypothetical protein